MSDFGTSNLFKEKFSDHFKDLHKLKILTNFDVNLTTFLGVVMNYVLNITFATPPIEIRQTDIKIFEEPQFTKISKMIRKFFLK